MASAGNPFAAYSTLSGQSTGGSGGFGPGNAGIQPLPGSGDQLTAFFRSLSNLSGTTGANLVGAGGQTTAAGLGTVGQGLQTMQPSVDFYQKLLSGDPQTMTAALAPTANLIGQQFESARTQQAQGGPMGGFRSTALANIPFAEASQVGNAALGLQSTAAQQLAGIGQGEAGIGLGVAGVGGQQTGQGLNALNQSIVAALQKMGINIQGGTANMFATVAGGLGALI